MKFAEREKKFTGNRKEFNRSKRIQVGVRSQFDDINKKLGNEDKI